MTDYIARYKHQKEKKNTCYDCAHADHNRGVGLFYCNFHKEARQRSLPPGKCRFWAVRSPLNG